MIRRCNNPAGKLACALFFTAILTGHAVEIAADYQAGMAGNPAAAPSPSGLGWTAGVPSSDVGNFQSAAVSPDGTTGNNAWRMLDNSTAGSQFLTWNRTLTSTQHADAASRGWTLATRIRVADPVAGNGGGNSIVLLYGNNASKRWILFLDLDASGQIVATLSGGPTVTLTGLDSAQYHDHQLVYDAASATAEYFVDGVSRASGYTGTSGGFNGVQWGTGSSGGRGDGYWNSVSFVISDPPPPPAPTVTAHPQSQSVASGTSVTLTAAFANAPTSYQWFRNAVPMVGETNPTLGLPSNPSDAGDYWCRASNASGSAETATAALEVLVPSAGLVVSEFLAENDGGLRDEDGDRNDWIELHNASTVAQSTAGYFLTDSAAVPAKWALPTTVVPPGGFLFIWASGKDRSGAGEWHTNFSLGNGGGYLALTKPDLSPATALTYPSQFADNSYGFTVQAAPVLKYFALPTPLALNADGQTTVKDGVSFSPLPGTFSGTVAVTLTSSAPPGAVLRYSTDGSRPTVDSPDYQAPLTLAASTNLRAAVLYPGERHGATATGAYLRLAADVQAFSSPLPILVVSNHGAGPVPGVNAAGPNGDGSNVVAVAKQAQNLLVFDEAAADSTLTSPVVNRSRAGMKIRGSSSFTFSKKNYTLETWNELDNVEREVSLLGMPADSEWVIYRPDPSQFDVTLLHNAFTYELARQSGFNAPRFRFVELFLDSGDDLAMADHRGLAIVMEKPSRGKNRVDFDYMNAAATAGGWMINVDRMDALPPGSVPGSMVPRHFHTAGPDGVLQTADDNARGYQGILSPGGAGSGSGLTPANDDMPNYYHSFFNFESPSGWKINTAQRSVIQTAVRNFDAALYGPSYQDAVNGYWPHIDASNWAHHLVLHTLTKNQDAVVLSGFLYRETSTAPLRWAYVWDFDRSFTRNPTNSSATANLTWAHDRLYYRRMTTDPEFMQAYIDQWQNLRRGALATANMQAIVDAQAAEITGTVAGRSGLTAAAWTTNLTAMKTWLANRAAAIDALYTAPPDLSQNGGEVPAGFSLTITAPAGDIYYTIDGSDPRQRGGATVGTLYAAPLQINAATVVTARAKVGGSWSGLTQAAFFPPQNLEALRVTEIHYNPPQDNGPPLVDGDEFEFFEFKNTGATPLNLSGLSLTGITYTFPAGAMLAPGQFWLLVRNPTAFAMRHPGVSYQDVYSGKLSNSGEALSLTKDGQELWNFAYGDRFPWPRAADGGGLSLQRPYPAMPGYDAATWSAAVPTPGADLALTDSDSDGMPDFFETLSGFEISNPADGAADADGDGQSNAAEYVAGTNLFDPAEVFAVAGSRGAGGGMVLDFTAVAGRSYSVQTSSDLQSWSRLTTVPAGPDTRPITVEDPLAPGRRFYRAVTPAVP